MIKFAICDDEPHRARELAERLTAYLKETGRGACTVDRFSGGSALLEGGSFDVILLDPPYHTDLLEKSMEAITRFDILGEHGIMVCESAADRELPPLAPPYEQGREYRYGKIKLTICRRAGSERT